MGLRISLKRTLLVLAGLFCLPTSAAALPPFDISDPAPRTVVIWFDNNVSDPSSVGNDLEFFFNGSWSSDGTTGTIVVDKDDVIAAFATSLTGGTERGPSFSYSPLGSRGPTPVSASGVAESESACV